MDNVRIAIVGIGNMGSGHASCINKGDIPKATLTAVCDVNPKRLEWAEKTLDSKVQRFATFDELLAADCCDAVIIATPHYFHPPMAIAAFDKGLHVLSEKPAGVFTRDVREMNEKAKASGLKFGMMFQQRMATAHQKLRDLVQSGEIGELRRVNWIITNWFRTQSYYDSGGWRATWEGEGGGVLINQCPHQLDLWQWICGMPSKMRAFCKFGESHDIEVEDNVTAYAEYENGATAVFITTTGEAPGTNRLEIVGTKGKLVYESGKIKFSRNRVPMDEHCMTSKKGFSTPECWQIDVPTGRGGGSHAEVMKNWTDSILNGTELVGPGYDGIKSLTLSNAMLLSTWTDSTIDLTNFDEDLFYDKLQEKIKNSTVKKEAAESKTEEDMSSTF
jgi:predicted dehydrogenase